MKEVLARLNSDLKKIDEIILAFSRGKSPLIQEISHHLIFSGGKRIRPVLLIMAAKLFGTKSQDNHHNLGIVPKIVCLFRATCSVLRASWIKITEARCTKHEARNIPDTKFCLTTNLGAAIELIHSATLLHDDVVDASQIRRGKKTANAVWDNKASILVGDYLFSIAFQLMVRCGNLRVLDLLSQASSIMADGEVMQLQNSNDIALSREKYLEIIFCKTAALFSAACECGALINNAAEAEISALREFGKNLGMIFQIVDDVLDYSSRKQILGKDIGNDFFEGKVTLPIIFAYKNASETEQKFIAEIFEKNLITTDKNHNNLKEILTLIKKYNSLEASQKLALNYHKSALENLEIFPESQVKQDLIVILNYSLERIS